jgi:heme exporter protein C
MTMALQNKTVRTAYWLTVIVLFAAAAAMLRWYTPDEATMGPIQKIFYLHLPSAINSLVACLVVFVAGIGYLWRQRTWWDDLALAAAKVAVLLCSVVLLSGMIWAKVAWGAWWSWGSTKLVFSLVLWLLYVVYLILRPSIESYRRRAMVSAVYGIIAFLDVPLVYLSAKMIKLPDPFHPAAAQLMAPEMKLTLAAWFIPVTMLAAGLIIEAFNANRRKSLQRQEAREA